MKKLLLVLILVSFYSCKNNKIVAQENKINKFDKEANLKIGIQEIGSLYKPEKMSIKQGAIRKDNKKENYQITLTNSNFLDSLSEKTEISARKVADLYYKNLIANIFPLNYDKISVNIEHRNGKKESFKFIEKDFLKNEIEFPINSKFTIQVEKIDETSFKYSILKLEPINKKLGIWNSEKLFEENGKTETIEFYFGETENKNISLIMQSRSKYSIKFKTEIQTEEYGEFEEIQNIGTHKGSKTSENWTKKTYRIRFSKFELKK